MRILGMEAGFFVINVLGPIMVAMFHKYRTNKYLWFGGE